MYLFHCCLNAHKIQIILGELLPETREHYSIDLKIKLEQSKA